VALSSSDANAAPRLVRGGRLELVTQTGLKLGDILEKPVDHRKQPSLLETDVGLEHLAKLAHDIVDLPAGGDELLEPACQCV
jgi:hypothetical protein